MMLTICLHFLEELSPATRRVKFFPSYDFTTAKALCDGIRRREKLLLVVELSSSQEIIGLFEISFDISEDDKERFLRSGVLLDERTDCRIGPCLADEYQNKGVGSILFPAIVDIAKKFGRKRMILWGGVFRDNVRAVRFYEKHGFRLVGEFEGQHDRPSLDMILEF